MKNSLYGLFLMHYLLFICLSCNHELSDNAKIEGKNKGGMNETLFQNKEFRNYWYSGKAELNRYKLKQSRYGEIHEGDAVLIFVTEDFLVESQVKYEGGEIDEDKVSVLKLNLSRKFNTGIYPYFMMSSVFTPIDEGYNTLKVTNSNQEWCGQTFSQLNRKDGKIKAQLYSYFMEEGDKSLSLKDAMLEDEIWNRIRLKPMSLPTGTIELIPGTQFLRMKHREFQVEKAVAELKEVGQDSSNTDLMVYKVVYQDFNRILEISFKKDFPYEIMSWSETVNAGFGREGSLTTTAVRTHSIKEPYWNQHSVADSIQRKKLGLD